jgi:SAM-dependent methyltransferase
MALNIKKASPTALVNAAQTLFDKGNLFEAETYLSEALEKNIQHASALALMADVLLYSGREHLALNHLMAAINADPSNLEYKERLIDRGGPISSTQYNELTERALVECLKTGDQLDCSRLRTFWASHLLMIPAFRDAFQLHTRRSFDTSNAAFFETYTNFTPLFTPYFLLGLRHIVVGSDLFEGFVTSLRARLLKNVLHGMKDFTPEQVLTLASALSCYSFSTDYILDETTTEKADVGKLRSRAEQSPDEAALALLACYMPLYALKNANQLTAASPDVTDILRAHVGSYHKLKSIAADVVALTPIDAGVSSKVQEQYEEFPYPRWESVSKKTFVRGWNSRNAKFLGNAADRKIDILIAGCGTGQEPAMMATVFPKADILAVDLSRSSLAYAINKADEYKLTNVTFRQADILRLGMIGRQFDHISSMGVLHHMEDPVKGWRVLYDLLKPGGTMSIGLYSKKARRVILKLQTLAKKHGYKNDAEGMKAFRRRILDFLITGELVQDDLNDLLFFRDYYFMTMYRDLVFHVQEYDYEIPELEKILQSLNLEFLGFSVDSKILKKYTDRFPADKNMNNLANWDAFEQENPSTFREMYYLWLKKPL